MNIFLSNPNPKESSTRRRVSYDPQFDVLDLSHAHNFQFKHLVISNAFADICVHAFFKK